MSVEEIDATLKNEIEKNGQMMDKKYKSEKVIRLILDQFTVYCISVAHSMTGRQLLNLLFNMKSVFIDKSIIILEIGNIQETAIVCHENPWKIRIVSLEVSCVSEEFLFSKYFNDWYVEKRRKQTDQEIKKNNWTDHKPYFTEECIVNLRNELQQEFPRFMSGAIGDFSYPERKAFIDLLSKIARNRYGSAMDGIPVEAGVKLAIDNGKSGQISDIFYSESNHNVVEERAEKVEKIIKSVLPCNENGLYDEALIEKYAKEIQ